MYRVHFVLISLSAQWYRDSPLWKSLFILHSFTGRNPQGWQQRSQERGWVTVPYLYTVSFCILHMEILSSKSSYKKLHPQTWSCCQRIGWSRQAGKPSWCAPPAPSPAASDRWAAVGGRGGLPHCIGAEGQRGHCRRAHTVRGRRRLRLENKRHRMAALPAGILNEQNPVNEAAVKRTGLK